MADLAVSESGTRPNRVVRTVLKTLLWTIVVLLVLVFGVAVYNGAFDEDLSAEAKALLVPRPIGKIDDQNGYVAFIGLVAPSDQDQMTWGRKAAEAYVAQAQPGFTRTPAWEQATKTNRKATATADWCKHEEADCLPVARANDAALRQVLADEPNALLLARYHKAREAPVYAELGNGPRPEAVWPNYRPLLDGAALARLEIAMKAGAGDFEGAVAGLEREVAFHRRIAAGSTSLVMAMMSTALVSRDVLLASELLRTGGAAIAPFHARLVALARPQLGARLLVEPFAREANMGMVVTTELTHMLRDGRGTEVFGLGDNMGGVISWIISFYLRPNETANIVARSHAFESTVLAVPASGYDAALAASAQAKRALHEEVHGGPWYTTVRNPLGKMVLAVEDVRPYLAFYAARVHDVDALTRMVDLQATLAQQGITEPAAIAAFVVGDGAKSHPDPYTGKPFAFDPATRQLSFKPRANGGALKSGMEKRFKNKSVAIVV